MLNECCWVMSNLLFVCFYQFTFVSHEHFGPTTPVMISKDKTSATMETKPRITTSTTKCLRVQSAAATLVILRLVSSFWLSVHLFLAI